MPSRFEGTSDSHACSQRCRVAKKKLSGRRGAANTALSMSGAMNAPVACETSAEALKAKVDTDLERLLPEARRGLNSPHDTVATTARMGNLLNRTYRRRDGEHKANVSGRLPSGRGFLESWGRDKNSVIQAQDLPRHARGISFFANPMHSLSSCFSLASSPLMYLKPFDPGPKCGFQPVRKSHCGIDFS